ncbi:MAG: hypothetical protein AAGC57_19695 [Pseudomonadota bacterium]
MRRTVTLAMVLAALGLAAAADEPMTVSPHRVIDVVTSDWNGDGDFDRAVLIEGDEDADLRIYLSSGGEEGMALAVARPDFVWRGAMWGTLPSLTLNAAGSLQVISGNQSIGRNRWQETITIVWRGSRFLVAGFTFDSHDTLDPGLTKRCDVNYLSGQGLLDERPFEIDVGVASLSEWGPEMVPPECAAG